MIPGPNQIVACPECEALAMYMTLASGNTFDARVWTDGKQIAPMLPLPPTVVKCHKCAECYWLADAREIGTTGGWGHKPGKVDPAWEAAPEVQEPSEADYYLALQKGLAADEKQERALRVLAWWRRNDAFRDAGHESAVANASEPSRKNLETLADLLNDSDENDRLMKAEVLRELGEFKSAGEILNQVVSTEYSAAVSQIRLLCESGDVAVRELQFSG